MAKTGKIHHPKDGTTLRNNQHLAASGTAQNVLRVKGVLIDTTTNQRYRGTTLLDPYDSASGGFWIVQFQLAMVVGRLYIVEIHDWDDYTLLDKSAIQGGAVHPAGIAISYPQGETIGCAEFAPYGTTSSTGGSMQATLGCDAGAQTTQQAGPTNWVLYCVSSATPGPCSLTVSQPGAAPPVPSTTSNFTCGRT